jgi:Holliday junction resolvase
MTKGGDAENEARKLLESQGYRVHKKVNNSYDRGDMFELFDILAVKPGKMRFIQVKSNSTQGALKKIRNNVGFLDWEEDLIEVEVWVRYDRYGWRNQRLSEDGWSVWVDERDVKCNIGERVKELV